MAPAHGLKLGQCGTRSPGAGVGPGLGFLIWVSREADQSQDGWRRGWVPVPQTTSPLLDSCWFTLVTLPVESRLQGRCQPALGRG